MNEHNIEERIGLLKNIDPKAISIEEIRKLIEPILKEYFSSTPLVDERSYLFRSVKLNNKKPKYFEDIIYPPQKYVTKYQRVNRPGNPVFYCSTSKKSSILEGRYKKDDLIALSEWEVTKGKQIIATNVGYTDYLKKWSSTEKIPRWAGELLINRTVTEIKSNELIKDYLSQLFCRFFDEDQKYKISVAISESLGFKSESTSEFEAIGPNEHKGEYPFDAILFPSLFSNGESDNLAIRRFSFHKKIKLISVDFCRIIDISETNFAFEELDFANTIDDQNLIEWKGRKGDYFLTGNVGYVLTKVADNVWTIARKDGGKINRQ